MFQRTCTVPAILKLQLWRNLRLQTRHQDENTNGHALQSPPYPSKVREGNLEVEGRKQPRFYILENP